MIEVRSNGKKYRGWETARITKSLDKIAADFALGLTPGDGSSFPVGIYPGDAVEIRIDDDPVFAGHADDDSPSFSAGSHGVSVSGRELTADLADCSLESPSEYRDRKADAIIGDICSAFGLHFRNPGTDVGTAFTTFSVEPGTSAFEVMQKVCRARYVIPVSDGCGNVSLFSASSCPHGDPLVQGENLLSASGKISAADRYSKYVVLGTGKSKKKVRATVTDAAVERYRPLVIVDSSATTQAQAQARAAWEAKTRAAKSTSFTASVRGWKCSRGIWTPGVICPFEAPAAGMATRTDMLVASVSLGWGPDGEVTELTLSPPDVFDPEPETEKKKKVKLQHDPYAHIRKEIRSKS